MRADEKRAACAGRCGQHARPHHRTCSTRCEVLFFAALMVDPADAVVVDRCARLVR